MFLSCQLRLTTWSYLNIVFINIKKEINSYKHDNQSLRQRLTI